MLDLLALFPDTNLLMQCRSLRELPWGQLSGAGDHVRIFLGRTVVREVDRFKSDGKARRSRRARNLSSGLLKQLLEARGNPVVVRESAPRVDAVLTNARPDPSTTPELDLTHADERIIAEATACGKEHDVTFLSHDTIALHTAQEQGIKWQRIPDDWLAEPEPDPSQKRIQELEARIHALESEAPAIDIALVGDNVMVKAVQYAPIPRDVIDELIASVKRNHPVKTEFHKPRDEDLIVAGTFRPPSHDKIQEYVGTDYPRWIESVTERLTRLHESLGDTTRCIEIEIEISNSGNAPASEALFEFSLSNGISFLHPMEDAKKKMGEPRLPHPPKPPEGTPHGAMVSFMERLRSPAHGLTVPWIPTHPHSNRRDPNGIYFKPVPDFAEQEHCFECEVFRHQLEPELFTFFAFIDEHVNGGEIRCRVSASNLAQPALAKFPVLVQHSESSTVEVAKKLVSEIER